MNKLFATAMLTVLIIGCAAGTNRSMPYDAWRLGFFVPDYMEAWIETADVFDGSGRVYVRAMGGSPSMGYPRALSKGMPNVFQGDPKGWPEHVGWGKGKYVMGADLPTQIYVRWQSKVEPQTYHTRIDIPEATREIMRKGEKVFCRADARWITDYREAIVVGLAPGGIVKVWVTGPCLTPIEVTRVQAKIDPVGPYDGKSNGKYNPVSVESQAYIKKYGIPYGSW